MIDKKLRKKVDQKIKEIEKQGWGGTVVDDVVSEKLTDFTFEILSDFGIDIEENETDDGIQEYLLDKLSKSFGKSL